MPATLTPFDDSGKVDPEALSATSGWLLDNGVTGLVGTGTMGEAQSLGRSERRLVIETLVSAADGRATVTAGVSSETPSISIAYAEDAHAARAVYARILPLARLDMRPKLVQYFKAAMDLTGRHGGPCRPPRLELSESEGRELKEAVAALGAGVTA